MPRKKQNKKKKSENKPKIEHSIFSLKDVDFSEILPTEEEIEAQRQKERMKKLAVIVGYPYIVTFKNNAELVYFTFAPTREKAKGEATKFFKESLHPSFIGRGWREQYNYAWARRVKDLIKYMEEGKVPVPDLMKCLKVNFPCAICGKDSFDYTDYKKGRCFFIESEGDTSERAKGMVVCYDCYKKHFKQ